MSVYSTEKIYLAEKTEVEALETPYLICKSSASDAAKILELTGFQLKTGASLYVRFWWANTASSPTLNVNGTGARYIMQNGAYAKNIFEDGVYHLVYDGSYWQIAQT